MFSTNEITNKEALFRIRTALAFEEADVLSDGRTVNEKLDDLFRTIENTLKDNKIVLELDVLNERLQKIVTEAMYEEQQDTFLQDLAEWVNDYIEQEKKDKQRSLTIHAGQARGIYRSLKDFGHVDEKVWGEDLDILHVLKGVIIISPASQDIQDKGAYILPPISLDEGPDLFISKVNEYCNAHPNKSMTLLFSVSAGSHWRLARVDITQGEVTGALLWDSLANKRLKNTTAFKTMQAAVSTLSRNNVAVQAQAVGIQHNGHSCMDYTVQKALQLKFKENDRLPAGLLRIRQADPKKPIALRKAIIDHIKFGSPELTDVQVAVTGQKNTLLNIVKQTGVEPGRPVPVNKKAALESALFKALADVNNVANIDNKELQKNFDELMARALDGLYQTNHQGSEKELFDLAREHAFQQLLQKFGLFPPEKKQDEEKPIDTPSARLSK